MGRYGMRGTPTTVLIGRDGTVRHHGFGQEDDMALGALVASALGEARTTSIVSEQPSVYADRGRVVT